METVLSRAGIWLAILLLAVMGVALAHARNVTSRDAQRKLVVGGGISADLLRLELQEP